jgi:Type II secretion system protein C
MIKLEKKQVPQFAALAAITVVGLGYAAYQLWSGSNPPRPATAAIPSPAASTGSPAYGPAAGAAPGADGAGPPAAAPGAAPAKALASLTTLPPSFTPDPFRPVIKPPDLRKPGQPPHPAAPAAHAPEASHLPPVAEAVNLNTPTLPPAGEWTPRALAGQFPRTDERLPDEAAPGAPARPAAQVAPAPLQRPAITLTGVIQGDPSVAILRGAQDERQVVRVNDRVAGRYIVKSISADGILLAASAGSRPDRWFLPLGADAKGKRL